MHSVNPRPLLPCVKCGLCLRARKAWFMASDNIACRVVVEGFVQGVGYRDLARRAALRLGISGWVRNRADGTVEALLSGAPGRSEAMLAELRGGPRGAEGTGLKLAEAAAPEEADRGAFLIRPTR